MTVQEQRQFILNGMKKLQAKHSGNQYGGYFSKYDLILVVFDAIEAPWIKCKMKSQYHGSYTRMTRRAEDSAKVEAIMQHLEEQGYIRTSKSGLTVKIIKTK